MSIRDLIREAARALEANRGRSTLTILGIVIGISAVITMTSLIGGVQQSLVSSLGLNAARLMNIGYGGGELRQKDLDKLASMVPGLEAIEGSTSGGTQMKVDGKNVYVGLTGGSKRYFEMTGAIDLIQGRLFTPAEEDAGARVAVLSRSGLKVLFGSPDVEAVGKSLELNGKSYQIIGVTEDGMYGGSSDDYVNVFMPAQTVTDDFNGGHEHLGPVFGLVREGVDVDEAAGTIRNALASIKGVPEDQMDDTIWTYTMKSQIDNLNQYMGSFQLIAGSVAGISLRVGGIGIMNMMLTNVTERIREIGVRRALGATRGDITRQFLAESAALTVAGGVIGIVLGYLASWGLCVAAGQLGLIGSLTGGTETSLAPSISLVTVVVAVGISVGIGLVFGYYPARRASRLDPVECLRYQ